MKLYALILLAATAMAQTPAPGPICPSNGCDHRTTVVDPNVNCMANGTCISSGFLYSTIVSNVIVAETDEHGCVSGQGYTWDESVKGCAITVNFTASRTLTCKITAQDVNKQTVTCWYTPTPEHKEPK